MDAANFSFSRTAFLFSLVSLGLLAPAGAFAQTAAFSPSLTTVVLQGNSPQADSISSTTSTQITFNASTAYQSGDPRWLTLDTTGFGVTDSLTGLTTPVNINIEVGQQAGLLSIGTHTATITLHATDSSGAPDVMISISYTTGSNGGTTAGALSVSPSSPSATVGFGNSSTVTTTLASTSTVPISFVLQTPSVSWVTSFLTNGGLTSGVVSSSSPVLLVIGLNAAGLATGTYSTTLVVSYNNGSSLSFTVTLGNGVNVGGSGSGSLQVSQNSISWNYTSGSGTFPGPSYVSVSSTSGAIAFGVTASSSNNWLNVTNGGAANLPATLTLSPNSNIGALATGSYTGTVTVNGSDGSSQVIYVYLVVNGGNANGLTVSPNPITLQAAVNGSSISQTVSVTSVTGGSLSASVSGSGLSVSVSNTTVTANVASSAVTVTGNPSGLANGTYVGTLTVTVGGVSQAVQVNFVVGTGSGNSGSGSTTNFAAAPSALGFVYQIGSGITPINQQEQVYLAGSGNYTAGVTTYSGGNWLSVSSTSGTLPSQFFEVYANASSLAAGTYTGAVTFTNTSTGLTSTVNVTLLVTGSTAVYASSTTGPGDLVFNYIAGTTSATQFQSLSLIASDNSAISVTAAVSNSTNAPWLSIAATGSVTTPAAYSVTVNASSLANGLYTGYITVTAAAGNSPLTIPVVLNVVGSTVSSGNGSGSLTLGTSTITLQAAVNGSSVTQQLTVSAALVTSFTASTSTSSCNNTWLSVSPAGSSVTNATLTVTGNPAGLTAQTCSGQVTLVSNGGTQTVPVTMIVGGSGGTAGNITVTANGTTSTSPSLTFTAQSLNASVAPQYLSVSSASGASGVTFVAALSGTSCGWVALGIVAGQPYTTPVAGLNIGATTTGLAAGTYSCTLTLTPTGGTAVTVPLTLTVIGVPTISVATTTLTFAYSAGAAAPAAQTVQVTGSGSSPATFTATATSTPTSWLSVTPASGSASAGTPASLSVSVDPSNLAAGTYSGTISITAGSGSTGSGTVAVTLTVTAPTPAVTTIVNGASFLGGAIAPGEFVTLSGTQLGPLTPLGPSIDSTGKIATTLGNVQVFFGGTAAPLTYVSSTQINCTVPYEVSGLSTIAVQLKYLSQPSNTVTLNVSTSAPGIFTATGTGTGQGAVLNQNFTLNTAGNPAAKGSIIQIYMTGEGVTSPVQADGAITPNATTVPLLTIAVKIGGQPASVVFEGEAPGIVAGVLQLNVMVPASLTSGTNSLVVTIGNNSSQAGLTVAIQ